MSDIWNEEKLDIFPNKKMTPSEFFDLCLNKPFRFWCCPNKSHKQVKWVESKKEVQAHCEECGEKSPVYHK